MQVRYVDGGRTAMSAMMFGVNNTPPNMNIVSDLVSAPALNTVSTFFRDATSRLNNTYYGDETINFAKSIVSRHGAIFDNNALVMLNDDTIRNPNLRMREIIASHPDVIRLTDSGFLNGFSDVIPDHDLYDILTSGMGTLVDDGVEVNMSISSKYSQDDFDGIDRDIILGCWDYVDRLIDEDIDPTSSDLSKF